ncbi:MAG: substrate binding domain-containing protein, partial [Quisquiliibacterium sp.]
LADSALVGVKLAANKRVVVASPAYLAKHGVPEHPDQLGQHNCLTFGNYGNQARGWLFTIQGRPTPVRVTGAMECNDGAVLHEWSLDGRGLAWRSMWEVGEDLESGRLVTVLDSFAAPDNAIYALFAQRRQLPLRVRMLIDHLKAAYASPDYWQTPNLEH